MDFTLIEHHPWTTAGIVIGGGILLFVVFRRGGNSAPASASYTGVDPGASASAAAAAAQTQQMQTYIQGLQLQGATQISLAQIGADVSKFSTGATAETIDSETAAKLALGLSSQQTIIEQSRINAGLQSKYIDAIIAAFGGARNPATVAPPVSVQTPNSPVPTSQNPPSTPYSPYIPGGTGGGDPVNLGGTNPGTVIPGGTLLLPYPNYENCDPRDSACVQRNQVVNVNWENADIQANRTNNLNHCLADAELSRSSANYASLVATCHAANG